MKRLIIITSTISLILIFTGLFFKNLAIDFEVFNLILDFNITGDQLTVTWVIGLFFFVFPVFSYYRWKDKDVKDYMLTQENIDKMNKSKKLKNH